MFGYHLTDLARTFAAMDDLQQRVGQAFNGVDAGALSTETSWPPTKLYETSDALVIVAEVPGVSEKDLEVTLKEDVLTLSGERKRPVPEGYQEQRQERRPSRFSRSFTLPFRTADQGLSAELKDGILTVRLPKIPEAQPRKIQINSQ
jgi:HSP20 family protein